MPPFATFPLGKKGRLGNQLFQFAATLGLAEKNGLYARFEPWVGQQYFELDPDLFHADLDTANAIDARTLAPDGMNPMVVRWLQHQTLWQDDREWARTLYTPVAALRTSVSKLLADSGVDPDACTVLHVRRGDYLDRPDLFPVASVRYYVDALSTFDRVGTPVVVSEDRRWCEEDLLPKIRGARLLDHADPIVHLLAMARFHRLVIANSSFSWWSAYLAPDPDVVCPTPWFIGPGSDFAHLQRRDWTTLSLL